MEIIQYRRVTTTRTGHLWQLALAKWAEIARNSPDLQPALALQQQIMRLLIDATEGLEDSSPQVPAEFTSEVALSRWARHIPAYRNVEVMIPAELKNLVVPLCETLEEGGAGPSARHIKDALLKGEIDSGSLLRVSLARNQKAIRTSAIHMGLAPDLVWLVGELASSPLAHHLQSRLLASSALTDGVREWDRGYCPCCGSWPAMVEMIDGARLLRCSFCAAAWALKSYRCVYCGNADRRFVAAAPDMTRQDRRLELCAACGSYTKVIEAAVMTPFPLLAIDDLATLDLDQGAMSREYGRPPLVDLDAIDPQIGC